MRAKDWNPNLYLKFDNERSRPSVDLVARIKSEHPVSIIDVGCGPGNSTQVLHRKWPAAQIIGVDNSPAMIEKAKEDYPEQDWLLFDADKDRIIDTFDIVFSNAAIQWIPNHEDLIKRFSEMLNEYGMLAVQIPLFFDMLLGKSIHEIAESDKWNNKTGGVRQLFTIHTPEFYFDILSKYFKKIDIWTTNYFHTMESHTAILEMIRSTGLKPYLERLEIDAERDAFEAEVLDGIVRDYPSQNNGKVLFPFTRLFFVAQK